jgi:3-hydroxypropanoate dehydrogenase
MSEPGKAKPLLSEQALDVLFRHARSHDVFSPEPISDAELRAIYDLAKWGPTTANSQPQRILFLRSEQAKSRLYPALSSSNVKKSKSAPAVALFAYDLRFFEHLARMFPTDARAVGMRRRPITSSPPRCATPHCRGLFHAAARASGLDCGPMSGFNSGKVDAEFFPDGQWRSNFLCCLGRGDPSQLPRWRGPLRFRRGMPNFMKSPVLPYRGQALSRMPRPRIFGRSR